MATMDEGKFSAEVTETEAATGGRMVTVRCHGRLVAGETEALRAVVLPLLGRGGRVVVDCADLRYVDSMGLGALVALKVSAINKGYGTLEFAELSPRIRELLRITKLTEYLARPDTINFGG